MANIHTCATCKIFRRKYDLRRYENTVQSEDTSSGEDEDSKSEDSESESEEQSEVETSESETSSNVDLEDNDIYQRWYERSMQVSEPARTEKYEKYVGAGMSEQQARWEKACERTLWATKSNFFDTYEEFLEATVQLEEDDTHQEIIADIEEKTRRGLDTSKAVKRVLPKHKHHFEASSNTSRMMRMLMIRIQTVWKMFWISHPRSVRVYFQLIKDIRRVAAQWPKGYSSQRKKLCAKSLKDQ